MERQREKTCISWVINVNYYSRYLRLISSHEKVELKHSLGTVRETRHIKSDAVKIFSSRMLHRSKNYQTIIWNL